MVEQGHSALVAGTATAAEPLAKGQGSAPGRLVDTGRATRSDDAEAVAEVGSSYRDSQAGAQGDCTIRAGHQSAGYTTGPTHLWIVCTSLFGFLGC